jgi:hypothetical protein
MNLSLDNFYVKNDRLYSYCKACAVTRSNDWRLRNPEQANRNQRKSKLKYRLQLLGLSLDQYNQIELEQNGLCAICHQPELTWYRLSIDHNHINGDFRGLLCHNCNSLLGLCGDNIDILQSAIQYLKERS